MKKEYEPPWWELLDMVVETGFAASSGEDVDLSEWTDYGEEEL